jgi:hypothetical protein
VTLETRLVTAVEAIGADVGAIETELEINHRWVQLTQAAYNALGTPDPNTLYVIVG